MDFNDIISDKPKQVKDIELSLRNIVLTSNEKMSEKILGGNKVKLAYFYIGDYNNAAAVIGPAKDHCKLFLHHTAKVDTTGFKLEGSGKHSKHIKFRSIDEITNNKALRNIMNQIAEIVAVKLLL